MVWKKSGLKPNVSCTIMRQIAVSGIHQLHPDTTSNLADLMCHTVSTTSKSYRLVRREKTSLNAARKLHGQMQSGTEHCQTSVVNNNALLWVITSTVADKQNLPTKFCVDRRVTRYTGNIV